jgi:hypothetical protein
VSFFFGILLAQRWPTQMKPRAKFMQNMIIEGKISDKVPMILLIFLEIGDFLKMKKKTKRASREAFAGCFWPFQSVAKSKNPTKLINQI